MMLEAAKSKTIMSASREVNLMAGEWKAEGQENVRESLLFYNKAILHITNTLPW